MKKIHFSDEKLWFRLEKTTIEWRKKNRNQVLGIRPDSVATAPTKNRMLSNVHFISIHSHSSKSGYFGDLFKAFTTDCTEMSFPSKNFT